MERESTPFEQLAAILWFAEAETAEPDYYRANYDSIDFAGGFIGALAFNYPVLDEAFKRGRGASLSDAANAVERAIRSGQVPDEKVAWIDRQMTHVLQYLLSLILNKGTPPSLAGAAAVVRGAFQKSDDDA